MIPKMETELLSPTNLALKMYISCWAMETPAQQGSETPDNSQGGTEGPSKSHLSESSWKQMFQLQPSPQMLA